MIDGIRNDRLDRATPPDGPDDGSGLSPGWVERAVERFLGPIFVFLVELGRHHGHQERVGAGRQDFGKDVQQVQLRTQPLGQPAGIADGLLGVGAEIGGSQDGLDLDHVAPFVHRSSRTKA